MGFDIYGRKPKDESGKYFRYTISCWPGLADFILTNCEDCLEPKERQAWFSNDGQKVSAKSSQRLADKLDALIESGIVYQHERAVMGKIKDFPNIKIDNSWTDTTDTEARGRKCAICIHKKNDHYFLKENRFCQEGVIEFTQFCRNSGGFEID